MESVIKTITPEVATVLLENNTLNRNISDHRVAHYARQMKAGKWKLNGETIIISDTGKLLEGQHRLWACVSAQVPFETFVVEGVKEDVFDTINTGKARTNGDILHIAGYKFDMRLASALRIYSFVKDGRIGRISGGAVNIPGYEVKELAEKLPGLVDIVYTLGNSKQFKDLAPVGISAALIYIFSEDNAQLANEFIKSLITGENLHEGNAVLALRNRLITARIRRPHPPVTEYYCFFVNAWNAYIRGATVSSIKGSLTVAEGDRLYPKTQKYRSAA